MESQEREEMRKFKIAVLMWLAFSLVAGTAGFTKTENHILITPDKIHWIPGPKALPPGTEIAILEGNPKAAGPFTMRVKFPAGSKMAPHWHPADERATVLSGTLYMGIGDKFDESKCKALPAGSFSLMKPGTKHFAYTKEETILQLNGYGPWKVHYLEAHPH